MPVLHQCNVSRLIAIAVMLLFSKLAIVIAAAVPSGALDNGVGRVPALGWSSWYASPRGSQVTEAFVKANAEALIASGLAAAGYVYVNVDEVRACGNVCCVSAARRWRGCCVCAACASLP